MLSARDMSTVALYPIALPPALPRQHETLLDQLLRSQQELSAVERFSHEQVDFETREPAQAKYYRSLLPASEPGPGQQYAFEVDLDACSGCKACVVACHNLNGLDPGESWRRVGLLPGSHQPDPP